MSNYRVFLIILDSLGVGALPDAHLYGDEGSNTLLHTAESGGGLYLPNLEALGLSSILDFPGSFRVHRSLGSFGMMKERSKGKDTTTGHWELAGLITKRPFPLFPEGFPKEILKRFKEETGYGVIGNKVASGTEIIEELGPLHLEMREPILYTSADSVFQLAAHEEVIPLHELYQLCERARSILQGEYAVARVIARPFRGEPGSFARTPNRRDFSLAPPSKTILDLMIEANYKVQGRGKISSIFAHRGITTSYPGMENREIMEGLLEEAKERRGDLIFANLVEFDMVYGHRNDPKGYARALEDFDDLLQRLYLSLSPYDILILTADHGCDPTHPGTDHTREYVPLLIAGEGIKAGVDLEVRESFADVAATLAHIYGLSYNGPGSSFWNRIREGGFLCH